MNFFSDLKIYINKKQLLLLFFLLIFGIFVTLLETLGLGLIGVFVMVLTDSEILISKIPNEFIKIYFQNKSQGLE